MRPSSEGTQASGESESHAQDADVAALKRAHARAHIALLIQPTQTPEQRYTDHFFDVCARVKLPLAMRISCPSDPSQVPPQVVAYARAQRTVVVVTRDLVIWEVA